jgi:hypothetical protein
MHFECESLERIIVPSDCNWILNDSTGAVDVIKLLNLSRSRGLQNSTVCCSCSNFSTLYAKIDLAGVKVLINEVFACVLNTQHLKFLLGQRVVLNFRFLWLKN